jgi:hypothetical protein
MAIVLLAVGLLVTAAGLVTIGFGIPINAFSLGNTLIVAGTVGVAAGLVLIGLAAAVGQLRKIADALAVRPVAGRPVRSAESAESVPHQAAPRQNPAAPMPASTRVPGAAPEAAQPEPRFPATAPSEPAGPLDWLRARPKPTTAPVPLEPPVVEVHDEAPLSPRSPQRQSEPEPRVWSPSRPVTAEVRPAPRTEQPISRATPQPPEPQKPDFDLVWPDRSGPSGEPARREEPVMPPPPRSREARPPERRPEAPVQREAPREIPREAPREAPKPPAERGPAILKSGVIDGMPYTLYADGSIEAELPSGTVKFASVDALRAHLEKQS